MATTAELQRAERRLTRLASQELAAAWRQVQNFAEAGELLGDILPKLIDTYGLAIASVAADWYDEARTAAEASGGYAALPASLGDTGADSLAEWASHHGSSLPAILELAQGGLERRILNASRSTIIASTLADPAAEGWQRVGVGECDFCLMLVSRGAVYTEKTADFASHDHCHCSAVPAFSGAPRPVQPFRPSARGSDADAERARQWIADHL